MIKNECEICLEDYHPNCDMYKCKQCNKKLCERCIHKYINTFNDILQYKCPYCRYNPNIYNLISILNKLDKSKGNIFAQLKLSFQSTDTDTDEEDIVLLERDDNIQSLRNEDLIILPRSEFYDLVTMKVNNILAEYNISIV